MAENYGVPEWNFIILPNYFDDDEYWSSTIEEECPEAYLAIANIGKRYTNPRKWLEACQIYDEHIGTLIDYYGGEAAILSYKEMYGDYPPGIKSRPKLTKKSSNKAFRETGILPPAKSKLYEPAIELSSYVAESIDGITDEEIRNMEIKAKKPKGIMRDILLDDRRSIEAKERMRNTYTTDASVSLDVISNFYASKDGKTGHNTTTRDSRSIDQYVDEYNESINDENQWESLYETGKAGLQYMHGSYLRTPEVLAKLEVAKTMAANGLPAINKAARKTMKEEVYQMIRSEVGEPILTKKEKKRAKKETKRYKENRERALQSDRYLSKVLTRNKLAINNSMRLDDLIARGKY